MGSRADSESYVPPGTYGMAGPTLHLCYDDERGDGFLRGYSDHEKEMLKRIILEHEVVFRGQVNELHRLWRVQRDLMLEQERNPFQTNSSSSPIPPPQHSTNENVSVFGSSQNRPNFEFVREGSAQSSANVAPTKKPMFDLRLPTSEYIENENGMESGFGIGNRNRNGNVSCFGEANGSGSSTRERILVSDLNEPVEEITGLDFLGVNRDPVRDRRADQGSSSGLFSATRKIANKGSSLEEEKGGNSSGVNFFNPDRNHGSNFTSSNSPGINLFSPYRTHQNSFQDRDIVAPKLFGQNLTFSFDPSQGPLTHILNSNNSNHNNNDNNNNLVGPTSFPILDSSPHYNNLNKNKGLVAGSIHPINPFLNNCSGYYLNAPHNSVFFGSSGGQSFDFSKLNSEKNLNFGTSVNLNEPIPEGNQEIKGIKLLGSNCGGSVSEADWQKNNNQEIKGIKLLGSNCGGSVSEPDWQKNNINLNIAANEDELSQKAAISASGVSGKPNCSNVKLLGFPFFGISSSNKSERRKVDSEHVGPTRQAIIDLNEDLPLEEDNLDFSKESNDVKIARHLIDLEMPASHFEEPNIIGVKMQHDEIEIERESGADVSAIEAANNIVTISKLKISPAPLTPRSDALLWFADIAVSGSDKPGPQPESDSEEDLFESMTLKLEEVKFCERKFEGENSSSRAGETGYSSLLFTRGRRGPARKRRQRRDFQRDVLPTIASLSRVEVTEDLQMIGGLMRACGQEFDVSLTRRVGRGSSNAKGKRQQRSPQVNPPQINPPQRTPPQANTVQRNPHVNPPQRIPKVSQPQKIPPMWNQQPSLPLVSQPRGGPLMGPPQKISLENQHSRNVQPNRPQKITLANQLQRSTLSPVHQPQGGAEVSQSDVALIVDQMYRSMQNNLPHRSTQVSMPQRITVPDQQQTVNQNSEIEGVGLSVIGWGRTTARRNRRPGPQKQQQGNNNNPPAPLN